MKINSYLIISLIALLGCTVHKRHFNKGYDVQWKGYYANGSNEYSEIGTEISKPCDTIKNKDGSVILAIVERIDSKKIFVTPCENSVFIKHEIDRGIVSSIRYSNGSLFENKSPEQLQKEREENLKKYRDNPKQFETELIKKEQEKLMREKGDAKQVYDTLNAINSEVDRDKIHFELNTDSKNTAEQIVLEPIMKMFFPVAYLIAGALLLIIISSELSFVVLAALLLLVLVGVSIILTLISWIRICKYPNRFKGRPYLRELLLLLLSAVAFILGIWLNA
jgi:hypothetical protein